MANRKSNNQSFSTEIDECQSLWTGNRRAHDGKVQALGYDRFSKFRGVALVQIK